MRQQHTIILVGISGVGKSHLASLLVHQLDGATHIQASQLLKDALVAPAEELRLGSIQNNQRILVAAFKHLRSITPETVILDAHVVVDGADGIEEIPFEVFWDFAPSGFIEVFDDPARIVARRCVDVGRIRPKRTPDEIDRHQARSGEIIGDYAQRLGVPAIRVQSGDVTAALSAFRTILTIK